MEITIDTQLIEICEQISKQNLNENEWLQIESSSMFQTKSYCGGYDADENEFCFSYFHNSNQELWFQFSLAEVEKILMKKITKLEARHAESLIV